MVEAVEKALSPRSTTFHQAVAEGSFEIVDKLINEGGCQQTLHEGYFPLHRACKSGHIAMVRMLLGHSYQTSAKKYEVEVDVVKEGGIDKNQTVDVQDVNGGTPLYLACAHGHVDVVLYLLDEGADIDAMITVQQPNDLYQAINPLQIASQQGHHALVQLLLDHEVDRDVTNTHGMHSLHLAAANGHTEVVRLLLSHGADVNAQADDGSTAMHLSCTHGHTGDPPRPVLPYIYSLLTSGLFDPFSPPDMQRSFLCYCSMTILTWTLVTEGEEEEGMLLTGGTLTRTTKQKKDNPRYT